MAGGFDGSVNIDTGMDTRGFKAGMDGILAAAKRGATEVTKQFEGSFPGDKLGASMQKFMAGYVTPVKGAIAPAVKSLKELADSTEKVAYLTDELPAKTNKWGTAVNGVKRGFLQMASALVPGLYRINRFSLGIDRVTTSATGAGAAFTKAFTTAAVSLVVIAVLVAALVGLFMGLYKQMLRMDGFKENVKGLELAFANLKNAAYSAIMPLFNALLPIVMQVVGWLTQAANAAAAFIAALSGSSTYMVYVADSVGGAADSAGELAENTKKAGEAAKGALAGFDQLNVLQMADAGAAGGGGGGGTGHWEERIIGEDIKKKVQPILDFFASVKLFFDTMKKEGWEAAFRTLFKPLEPKEVPSLMDGFLLSLGGFMDDVALSVETLKGHVKEWGLGAAISWELDPRNWFTSIPGTPGKAITNFLNDSGTAIDTFKLNAKDWGLGAAIAWELNPTNWFALIPGGVAEAVANWLDVHVATPLNSSAKGIKTGDWSTFSDWYETDILKPIAKLFGITWEGPNGIEGIVNGVAKGVQTGDWSTLSAWFDTNVWGLIKSSADALWASLFTDSTTIGSDIGTSIGDMIIGAVNSAIGVINDMLMDIQNVVNGVIDAIDIFNSGKQYITVTPIDSISDPTETYSGGGYGGYGYTGGASGLVIPPNAPFAAIYGDQRSGRNLESPESLMRQIVREETAGMGGQAQGGSISFDVDETGLMRYLHPKFTAETKRVGTSMAKASMA